MSGGGWGKYAAIGIAILLALGVAVLIYRDTTSLERFYQHQAEQNAQAYRDTAGIHAQRRCAVIARAEVATCIQEEYHAAREREREEYDLQAQLVTSAWTRGMGLAAIIGMFVGIVGVGLIYVTFQETRRAANAAQQTHDAFIAVERAKLVFNVPAVVFDRVGFGLRIYLRVDNMGKSAALVAGVRWWHAKTANYSPRQIKRTDVSKMVSAGADAYEVAMITSAVNWMEEPYVTGWVVYDSAFSKGHRSHFCFAVRGAGQLDKFGHSDNRAEAERHPSIPEDT